MINGSNVHIYQCLLPPPPTHCPWDQRLIAPQEKVFWRKPFPLLEMAGIKHLSVTSDGDRLRAWCVSTKTCGVFSYKTEEKGMPCNLFLQRAELEWSWSRSAARGPRGINPFSSHFPREWWQRSQEVPMVRGTLASKPRPPRKASCNPGLWGEGTKKRKNPFMTSLWHGVVGHFWGPVRLRR